MKHQTDETFYHLWCLQKCFHRLSDWNSSKYAKGLEAFHWPTSVSLMVASDYKWLIYISIAKNENARNKLTIKNLRRAHQSCKTRWDGVRAGITTRKATVVRTLKKNNGSERMRTRTYMRRSSRYHAAHIMNPNSNVHFWIASSAKIRSAVAHFTQGTRGEYWK